MSVQLVSGADMVAQGVRNRVSDAEWTARVDLAALYRVVHYFRLTDTIYTHISMRIPGPEEAFLINSFGLMYDEICASNLVKVNVSGDILDDPVGLGINRAGFVIHGAIHGARHDVNSVLHTHTRAGIAVNLDEQQRLIADLGSKYAMILNNHGLLTAGRTPGETIKLMLTLERACDAQIAAFSGGIEVVEISSAAQQSTTNTVDELDGNFARDWAAMLRLAHRTAPGFDQ
jgi:ribulose-5-phosphate 4-epimerase/fuculose-1-phosphate aldolase